MRNLPITSDGVKLVPLRLLTPDFLTLPIQLKSVAPVFVGIAGVAIVVEPDAVVTGTEGMAKTETEEWLMAVSVRGHSGGGTP